MEITLPKDATKESVSAAMQSFAKDAPLGNVALATTKDSTVLMRFRDISNEEHLALLAHLKKEIGTFKELDYTTIGPTVGESLKRKSVLALGLASIMIVVYIAFAFRKIPKRLSPWRFGIIAVGTLLHDVLITAGVFVIISRFTTFEFDTLFITALLTILGYSVNDTIVVFDRIRDNVNEQLRKEEFAAVADRSLNQSITRSVYTSFSTIIMLLALYFLGPESIRWFVLTLILGIFLGTYSSIFLATPLLVYWKKRT